MRDSEINGRFQGLLSKLLRVSKQELSEKQAAYEQQRQAEKSKTAAQKS